MDATCFHSRRKHRCEPAFQSKATDAAVFPGHRLRNLPAQSPRRTAARWDLAILVRYRPGRRPTIKCRVMFCKMVGSIALAGALDPKDLRRVIGPSASPRRTIGGAVVVGRFRRPNTWEDRAHPCGNKFEFGSGRMALRKQALIPLPTRCELSLSSLVDSSD